MKYTKEQIENALAAGATTFTGVYRHVTGKPGAKAPGGFAKSCRILVPGIFGTPPDISSDESLETVEPQGYVDVKDAKAPTINENNAGAPISPSDALPPPPSAEVPTATPTPPAQPSLAERVAKAKALPNRNKLRANALADVLLGPIHHCLKCGSSRFKTISKGGKTYACRNCGTVTPEPNEPTPEQSKIEAVA